VIAALARIYLEQSALLALGWLVFQAGWAWARRWRRPPLPGRWLRLVRAALLACLVLPVGARLLPREAGLAAVAGRRAVSGREAVSAAAGAGSVRSGGRRAALPRPSPRAAAGLGLALLAGVLARGWLGGRRIRALSRALRGLPVVRRHGRVTLCASDAAPVPYAARACGRAWVVVPTDLLDEPARLRPLVAHELQHHRQGDTRASQLGEALAAAFFWHPLLPRWRRLLDELQELACDAAVVAGGRFEAHAYSELLLWAATPRERFRFVPAGASAASRSAAGLLKRRLMMLKTRSTRPAGAVREAALGAGCLLALMLAAITVRGAAGGRAVSEADVRGLAEGLARSGLAVPANAVIVEEVNAVVGFAERRAAFRDARERLAARRATVARCFERHGVPLPLAALAVVESGFHDLPGEPEHGAGVWQLIPQTARRFGLRVEQGRDERRQFARETEAAARYLALLHERFRDWPLALAAYSQGEAKVEQAVEGGGTRDAWELIARGRLGRYAGAVLAAALVLEHPHLLAE